jgi:hypothetical protein
VQNQYCRPRNNNEFAVKQNSGRADESRQVDLIQNLVVKTKEGKIPWAKQGTALTTAVPGGLQVNFVLSPNLFGLAAWQLLTVRDQNNELMRVTNPSNVLTILAGKAVSPVVAAADDLFNVVYGAVGDDLDRAIKVIKKL